MTDQLVRKKAVGLPPFRLALSNRTTAARAARLGQRKEGGVDGVAPAGEVEFHDVHHSIIQLAQLLAVWRLQQPVRLEAIDLKVAVVGYVVITALGSAPFMKWRKKITSQA